MKKMELISKIKKMGDHRLYFYIPKKDQNNNDFSFRDIIKLKIMKDEKFIEIISKYNYLINLKTEIVRTLDLRENDEIKVVIAKGDFSLRTRKPIKSGKLDLLFFAPLETIKGSNIIIEEFIKDSIHYLRLGSFHNRGSSRNIEIKRFVDLNLFGKLLGQIQAEGSKYNFGVLEFCNKSLTELKDNLDYIDSLGISRDKVFVKLDYHKKIYNINEEIKKFEDFVGLKVNYRSISQNAGVGFGFKIIVRSTIFSQLILDTLKGLRPLLEMHDNRLSRLKDGYFAKLLSGDGHFEITSKDRKKVQSRVKIVDGNHDFLKHYKKIMESYGFRPYINEKHNWVRALCNLDQAKMLLEIEAFDKNPNQDRIRFFINSLLKAKSK